MASPSERRARRDRESANYSYRMKRVTGGTFMIVAALVLTVNLFSTLAPRVIPNTEYQLMIVSPSSPLDENYTPSLIDVGGSIQVDARILPDLSAMLEAATADGVGIVLRSGYRSSDHHRLIYENEINGLMAEDGLTRDEAMAEVSSYMHSYGFSERQTGLVVELIVDDNYAWLTENAATYGFILRYPEGKKAYTGLEHNEALYRYVGTEHAANINSSKLSLEEYVQSIEE